MCETIETEEEGEGWRVAYIRSIVAEEFEVSECVIKKKITVGGKKDN